MTAVLNTTEEPISEADVEWVLEELGKALTAKLRSTLAAMNGPLEQEHDKKTAEAQTLRAKHRELQARVQARQRVLGREIDELVAQGGDAGAKRDEGQELERNLRGLLAQAEEAEQRSREITHKMAANYRACFESAYPEIRQTVIAAEIALCKLLERVRAGLLRYEAESGLRLLTNQHLVDLTPRETGQEAPYFASLRRWFGGRQ